MNKRHDGVEDKQIIKLREKGECSLNVGRVKKYNGACGNKGWYN